MFDEKFDNKLRNELSKHTEVIPDDFKHQMLDRIEQAENKRVLNRIIWQERLPLIGYMLIGVIAITVTLIFPDGIDFLMETFGGCIVGISKIVKADYQQWYPWGIYSAALGFVVYCFVDLFVSDS